MSKNHNLKLLRRHCFVYKLGVLKFHQKSYKMPRLAELDSDENNEHARTFVFESEGHTLGNVLKWVICRYPDVEFCGYTVPHPAENKMHLRIQTTSKSRPVEVLKRGLQDLEKICDVTIESFENALTEVPNS